MRTDTLIYPKIRAGRYAVPDMAGTLKFYHINKPTKGKWIGWLFLSFQASDDLYKITSQAERERIFYIINQDPFTALQRYGQEIGQCGHCGRTLTDETSRKLGIGPVCREGLGL